MSWYTEDKKMREDLIGKLVSLCKRHNYELGEENLKMLRRMKFAELGQFSSRLFTRLNQRQHEVWDKALKDLNRVWKETARNFCEK
jgi:hypothetical protein